MEFEVVSEVLEEVPQEVNTGGKAARIRAAISTYSFLIWKDKVQFFKVTK